MTRCYILVSCIACALSCSAVSDDRDPDSGADGADQWENTAPDGERHQLIIVSPQPGDEVGRVMEIRLEAIGLDLVEPDGRDNVLWEGHLGITLDGVPIVQGNQPLTVTNIDVHVCTLAAEVDGDHNLEVVGYNNDGTVASWGGPHSVKWTKLPGACL